jgi:hypothetical protein
VPDTAAPARQRPEDILAATLTGAAHPEATDGWSARGRRIFLVAMAVAGVLLVVAGLLVTKQLGPGPGHPAPLETGPGNGLADQLLKSGDQPAEAPPASSPLAFPLPSTPTSQPAKAGTLVPAPATAPGTDRTAGPSANAPQNTPPTAPPSSPTTSVPCTGLLGQNLQQTQIPLPCRAPTSSPLTSRGL